MIQDTNPPLSFMSAQRNMQNTEKYVKYKHTHTHTSKHIKGVNGGFSTHFVLMVAVTDCSVL